MEENNKNLIVALILMAVVWFGYNLLFPPQPQISQPAVTQEVVKESPKTPQLAAKSDVASSLTEQPKIPNLPNAEQRLTVETDLFSVQLSNIGGNIDLIELKNYRREADSDELFAIIHPDTGFSTSVTGGTDEMSLSPDAVYAVSLNDSHIKLAGSADKSISFTTVTSNGIVVEKTYTFYADRYTVDLAHKLVNGGNKTLRGRSTVKLVEAWDDELSAPMYDFVGPVSLVGEELETVDPKDLKKGSKSFNNPLWSGFETKYFFSAAVPLKSSAEQVELKRTEKSVENIFISPQLTLAPQESHNLEYLLYFGPRDPDHLEAAGHRLVESIDYGFFALIAEPLVHILKFLYKYIGNYGLCIIVLTIMIKALFWPLTHKSYASMKAMQKLQPEIQKIRDKYKNDREKMNQAVMQMYKEKKVNPVGGCLPMLVQIPVFFALYKALLGTIDLRHAEFGLWLTDLSAKDPYYITPVIMGATMFIQQKMSPSTMDPAQARIFMMMPIIFTFLFLNFPSGLVIYWLVNNVLTILQQYLINKKPA